jgi:hypothetical protein
MSFKKTLCRIQISQFRSLASVRTTWYSVWTTRTFHPNAHQCLEASNCPRLHPSERNGKSPSLYSEFEKNPAFKYIRPKDMAISSRHRDNTIRTPFSVQQVIGFLSQTQIWEDSCNRLDDVCSRPDAILDKASHAEEVQPSRRQTPWSGHSELIMEIVCSRSATVRTLGQHRPITLPYFDHIFLLKYRIRTKSASLES